MALSLSNVFSAFVWVCAKTALRYLAGLCFMTVETYVTSEAGVQLHISASNVKEWHKGNIGWCGATYHL